MPLLYSGSGRWGGDTAVCGSPELRKKGVSIADYLPSSRSEIQSAIVKDTVKQEQALPSSQTMQPKVQGQPLHTSQTLQPKVQELTVTNKACIKQRKFSFKKGKVSVKAFSEPNSAQGEENILLEVEGKEISVKEDDLLRHSLHFSRIFQDIALHADSEFIQKEGEEDDDLDTVDNPLAQLEFETVQILMEFIANQDQNLEVSDKNVEEFQKTARLLRLPAVEKTCQKFVEKGLSTENCITRFLLADSFLGWEDTARLVEAFIQENIDTIFKHNRDQLLKINEHQLKRLLLSPNSLFSCEDVALELVLAWSTEDADIRVPLFPALLECVQLPCLTKPHILLELQNHSLVTQDKLSINLVQQGLHYHRLTSEEKVELWKTSTKPTRWPHILVALSYAEKVLEYYDFQTQEWAVLTEKPDWVFGAELVSCGSDLFTIGGVSSRQVDRYQPDEDQWTNGSWPSLRKARLAHGVCVVEGGPHGGTIYTAGGSPEVGGRGHSDMEHITPGEPPECDCSLCGPYDHLAWQLEEAHMDSPRTFTAMATSGENIYMVGGDQAPDNSNSSVEVFSLKSRRWRTTTSTALKRDSCRLAVLGGELIAIGGYDNNSNQFLNSCERFALKTERWSAFPRLKVARRSPGVVTYRGQIFCIGGMGAKKDLSSMEYYSSVTKKWSLVPGQLKHVSGWISAVLLPKPVRLMPATLHAPAI